MALALLLLLVTDRCQIPAGSELIARPSAALKTGRKNRAPIRRPRVPVSGRKSRESRVRHFMDGPSSTVSRLVSSELGAQSVDRMWQYAARGRSTPLAGSSVRPM